MLRPGGTLLLVAHDSTNLAEGTGGPQDPSVLMTAEDVLADLDGLEVEVVRAERVAREVRPIRTTSTAARSGVRPGTAWCGSSAAERWRWRSHIPRSGTWLDHRSSVVEACRRSSRVTGSSP